VATAYGCPRKRNCPVQNLSLPSARFHLTNSSAPLYAKLIRARISDEDPVGASTCLNVSSAPGFGQASPSESLSWGSGISRLRAADAKETGAGLNSNGQALLLGRIAGIFPPARFQAGAGLDPIGALASRPPQGQATLAVR
jgi:hypothetical protein